MIDGQIRDKIIAGGAYVVIGKLISFPCGLLILAQVTRLLTPQEVGIYFLVFSLMNFFSMVSLFGMEKGIVKFISTELARSDTGRSWSFVIYVFRMGLCLSGIVFLLLISQAGQLISISFLETETVWLYMPLVGTMVILMTFQRLVAESFRGYHDIKFASIFNGVIPNLLNLFLVFLGSQFIANITLSQILYLFILSYSVNNLLGFLVLYKKYRQTCQLLTEKVSFKEIFSTLAPLFCSTIFLSGIQYFHLWLLAGFSIKEDVAVYGAILQIVIIISTLLDIIRLVVPSFVNHLYATKKFDEVEQLLRKAATLAALPSLIIFILIILLGKPALDLIYGSYYAAGYSALAVMAVAQFINVLTGLPGVLLIMASMEKTLFRISVVSGSTGLLISFICVQPLGYFGVAIGAGSGMVLQNLFMAYYCYRRLSINTFADAKLIPVLAKDLFKVVASVKHEAFSNP